MCTPTHALIALLISFANQKIILLYVPLYARARASNVRTLIKSVNDSCAKTKQYNRITSVNRIVNVFLSSSIYYATRSNKVNSLLIEQT